MSAVEGGPTAVLTTGSLALEVDAQPLQVIVDGGGSELSATKEVTVVISHSAVIGVVEVIVEQVDCHLGILCQPLQTGTYLGKLRRMSVILFGLRAVISRLVPGA